MITDKNIHLYAEIGQAWMKHVTERLKYHSEQLDELEKHGLYKHHDLYYEEYYMHKSVHTELVNMVEAAFELLLGESDDA